MWAPLSRTPICLDTLCCRLDNRNISLGETGTTSPWKTRSQQCLWPGPSEPCEGSLKPWVGGCLWDILPPVSLWVLVTRAVHRLCLLSHAWAGEESAPPLLFIQGYSKIPCSGGGKKKLIPSILFPIELNRFLIESLLLWVIDLTVRAN